MQDIQTVYRIKLIDQCCIQSSLSSTLVDHFKLYYHHPGLSINKFDELLFGEIVMESLFKTRAHLTS